MSHSSESADIQHLGNHGSQELWKIIYHRNLDLTPWSSIKNRIYTPIISWIRRKSLIDSKCWVMIINMIQYNYCLIFLKSRIVGLACSKAARMILRCMTRKIMISFWFREKICYWKMHHGSSFKTRFLIRPISYMQRKKWSQKD